MTRRRHPVKKVLAVACRTFGLDLEKCVNCDEPTFVTFGLLTRSGRL